MSKPTTSQQKPAQQGASSQAIVVVRAGAPRPPPRGRKKSNSQRGREFRDKRKKYEATLTESVQALRKEVNDLRFLRGVRQESLLYSRHNMGGSLVRLVEEYFAVFANGTPDAHHTGSKRPALANSAAQIAKKQEDFVHSAMTEDLRFGEATGVAALLDQWRRYTSYHSSFRATVIHVSIAGCELTPTVTVTVDLQVRFSRETFAQIFPHVVHNDAFVEKHIGRVVTYRGINQFQFSEDGRIAVYSSDVGFVDALVNSGMSLTDVAILMQQALIADHYLLGENPEDHSPSSDRGGASPSRVEELTDADWDSPNQYTHDKEVPEVDHEDDHAPEKCHGPTKRSRQLELDFILS